MPNEMRTNLIEIIDELRQNFLKENGTFLSIEDSIKFVEEARQSIHAEKESINAG